MRILYPTALADAAPPDVDAAASADPLRAPPALAVTAADVVALGWGRPGDALDAALAAAVDLSVSVARAEGTPPGKRAKKDAAPAAPAPVPSPSPPLQPQPPQPQPQPPPVSPHSVGDLVWVPLGGAWWPAEVVGVDPAAGAAAPSLAVTVLALNAPLTVPAAGVATIGDGFDERAAGATTVAGREVGARRIVGVFGVKGRMACFCATITSCYC